MAEESLMLNNCQKYVDIYQQYAHHLPTNSNEVEPNSLKQL